MPKAKEKSVSLSVYLPDIMLREAESRAGKMKVDLGTLFWLAWELGKGRLYTRTTGLDSDGLETKPREAPMVQLPTGIKIPKSAKPPKLDESNIKVSVSLEIPKRVYDEIRDLSVIADRSQSWIIQNVYLEARPGLFGQ